MFLPNDWYQALKNDLDLNYVETIATEVKKLRNSKTIYPPQDQIFQFLNLCPYQDVKAVIIGQDPYHGFGQANGLAFSVNRGITIPPSLRNIYKELSNDLNLDPPSHGDLSKWALEGVLLMNSSLTVEESKANSHQDIGWQYFTDGIISHLSKNKKNLVFILWGNDAKKKEGLIDNTKHLLLTSSHPSPLSARHSFFGGAFFSKTNQYLKSKAIKTIDWTIR